MRSDARQRLIAIAGGGLTVKSGVTGVAPLDMTLELQPVTPAAWKNIQLDQCVTPVTPRHTSKLEGYKGAAGNKGMGGFSTGCCARCDGRRRSGTAQSGSLALRCTDPAVGSIHRRLPTLSRRRLGELCRAAWLVAARLVRLRQHKTLRPHQPRWPALAAQWQEARRSRGRRGGHRDGQRRLSHLSPKHV
jgi:hypothetical protein